MTRLQALALASLVVGLAASGCTGKSSGTSSNVDTPACTSFTYSDWTPGTCPASGTQTRTITGSLPAGCSGGTPEALTQSCTPGVVACTSFTYSDWSACTNGTRTRTVLTSSPVGCTGGTPYISESCGQSNEGGAPGGGGTDYHVGAGEAYTTLGAVPWYNLKPGDTVYVHPGTYHEKILISTSGTETQWIRVRGVPDANGNLPIISGANATTSANNHWRWADPQLVQWDALVAVAVSADSDTPPHYVEIAGLQIQDATPAYSFTAENGNTSSYEDFAACIYARAPVHLLVRDNILTNCGQGFYNWTGSGTPADTWYSGLATDIVLRNNYFHDNGWPGVWTSHQTYTEADGVIIEGNRFGPVKAGMYGNHIKDRSAGSVIRYNYFEEDSEQGYFIDLVEPEEGCPHLCYSFENPDVPNAKYLEAFVYGNIFVRSNNNDNFLHWNEDHQVGAGRALEPNGRLYFYDNTIVDTSGLDLLFIEQFGAYECPSTNLPGRVDFRNNLVYSTAGTYQLGEYCYGRPDTSYAHGNWDFGANWVSPTWSFRGSSVTGTASVVSPADNNVGFESLSTKDYRLAAGSSALSLGAALAPAATSNYLGLDLTPTKQYVFPHATPTPKVEDRAQSGVGSDLGAFER